MYTSAFQNVGKLSQKTHKMKILFASVLLVLSLLAEFAIGHATDWPDGKYCLPMPPNGRCPNGWKSGFRKHDCEDNNNNNQQSGSVPYQLDNGRNIEWGFCCKVKTYGSNFHATGQITLWPKGEYCIFRKGGSCPLGFGAGSIKWDDEDNNNINSVSGTLPDGDYGRNTKIQFCCRSEHVHVLNGLPKCHQIMLMRHKGTCPRVAGYQGPKSGSIYWDNEDRNNEDRKTGVFPDGIFPGSGLSIEFCTYTSMI